MHVTRKSIGLVITALALVLAACGTANAPNIQVTARPTQGPTEVAADSTSEATTEATADATVEATAEATSEATSEATADGTSEATPEATVEATADVAADATADVTADATDDAAAEPTTDTATEPVEVAAAEGDPANGQTLFTAGANGAIPCTTCHTTTEQQLVGPGLLGIPERAAERVPGEDAVTYLHQSIVAPDAYVVPNFPPGVMPQNYDELLSEDQINDLVAYLMTLTSE